MNHKEIIEGLEKIYRLAHGVRNQIHSLKPAKNNSHYLLDIMFDPLFNAIDEIKKPLLGQVGIKECTREEHTEAVMDNYSALHKPICVKERGESFMEGEHGFILKPQDCYMDIIGPFKEIDDFWKRCDEEFADDEFMVVSHLRDSVGKTFVWTGDYNSFQKTWELD